MAPTSLVAIGFGSSLGDRRGTLELAVRRMGTAGMRLVRASRWLASPPLKGGTARNPFLNGVALYETSLSPEAVLARCRSLEDAFGRRRARHWGDRTLDVDVLQYGDRVSNDEALILPHPAIAKRPFVLDPLVEVWPDAVDPVTGARWATVRCDARPRPWLVGVPRRP